MEPTRATEQTICPVQKRPLRPLLFFVDGAKSQYTGDTMKESNPLPRLFQFAEFRFDTRVGELRNGELILRVPQQPLQVLGLLLEHAGELVSREELRTLLWPDGTFLDFEDGINHAVRRLRDALGIRQNIRDSSKPCPGAVTASWRL